MIIDICLAGLVASAFYSDLKYRKIYNAVLFPIVICAFFCHFQAQGLGGILFGLQGLIAGLVLLFIPFALGGMGAGDVKLLAAIGALKGTGFVFYAFLASALIGGVMSIAALLYRKKLAQTVAKIGLSLQMSVFSGSCIRGLLALDNENPVTLPYGAAITLGTIAAYWVT